MEYKRVEYFHENTSALCGVLIWFLYNFGNTQMVLQYIWTIAQVLALYLCVVLVIQVIFFG